MSVRPRAAPVSAFSLLELILAMAVIAIVTVLVIPSITSLTLSSKLTGATDQLVGLLGYARQSAIALNHTVEVRFYQFTNLSTPSGTAHYQAVQVFEFDDGGNALPLTKVQFLPDAIILDAGSVLSPLLGASQAKSFQPPLDPKTSLPQAGTRYACAAFTFSPGGITSLAATSPWFVTLHKLSDGDNLASPPANYATIQIDPVSGSVKTYRP